uniref:WD repeat-containing protein 76 n=2 Tax=Noccaea caerulescens TaxID=107243 RepID=A0A1J3JJI4_NOCCA
MATEYERKRLENIRRNDEMLAALNVHAKASNLSAAAKRFREESTKSFKKKKTTKPETPIVIRQSLRTRGLNPDSGGLPDGFSDNPRRMAAPTPRNASLPQKQSARLLAPLPFDAAYGGDGSHKKFVETMLGIARKPMVINGEIATVKVCKDDYDNDNDDSPLSHRRYNTRRCSRLSIKKEEPISSSDYVEKEENRSVKDENESPMVSTARLSNVVVKKEEPDCSGDGYVKKEAFDFDFPVKPEKIEFESGYDSGRLSLKPQNVARVVPGRILVVKFLPCEDVKMVAAGDKLGNVGFWNLDHCKDEDKDENENGIYLFQPHTAPVSSLVFQQNSISKVFSSSYDGLIRLMDVEKSVFDLVYSSDEPIFSLSQRPNDEQGLYFCEGYGMLKVWDLRAGKSMFHWDLHEHRINSIDFNPRNPHVMATSSTDGTACLWDLRSMGATKPKTLRTVIHGRAVHSAYFSPSGLSLATTSVDNYLGITSGANFEETSMIYHDNATNRWISTFRGVWGWDDSYIFVGNRSKGIDVISPKLKRTVKELHDPLQRAIPCRIHCHPLNVGMLAGSTAGGQVYVWTTK